MCLLSVQYLAVLYQLQKIHKRSWGIWLQKSAWTKLILRNPEYKYQYAKQFSNLIYDKKLKQITSIWHCTGLQELTQCFNLCPNITSTFRTLALFKRFVEEDNNWKKNLYACLWSFAAANLISGSWVVSIKQNTNLNFQAPLIVTPVTKMFLLKVVHLLKVYQHAQLHWPTLTFASTSEVWISAIL
jgi:hypothetical protein